MTELRIAIEVREDAERLGPGRLVGELVTYGKRAIDRPEMFAAGAFHWPDEGVRLNRAHVRAAPIMRFTPILDGDRLLLDARLPDTVAGRDAATEVRDGLLPELSVEFTAERESREGGLRVIQRARLTGAGLVDAGSYGGRVDVRHAEAAAVALAALRRRSRWR